MTSRPLLIVMLTLAFGLAPHPAPAQQAAARADLSDIAFLQVFLDLSVTRQQAAVMAQDMLTLQAALAENRAALDRAAEQAAASLPDLREVMLRGDTPDGNQAPLANRLAQLRATARQQQEAAIDVAYQRVLNRLTPQQLTLLGYQGSAFGAPQNAVQDTATDTAARLQQNYLVYGNLFRRARKTPMPDRLRRFAPAEVVRATSAATALPAGHPALNQLNRLVYSRLVQVYLLPPLEYRQFSPDIAWELAVASQTIREQAGAAAPEQIARNAVVEPARLREALTYERGPALLRQLVERRQAGR